MKFLKNSLAANARRLDQFLNEHTEESVAADEQSQREARSLLNIRSQLEGALSAAESGHPICYALEVQGSRANLERLRAATVVTASVDAGATAGQDPHLRVTLMKPEAYKAEFRDPVVETASPRDVYALVTQAASASKQE